MTTRDLQTEDPLARHEAPGADDITVEDDESELLFSADDRIRFDRRWRDIQSRFIDDPHQAVESADNLVVEVMDQIGDRVAQHRSTLAKQRDGEDRAETEDLRLAIRRYRALFHRLLSA